MLYLVPTPIGNLKDITLRALEVLQQVELVLAEDTRMTKKLLRHFEITTPVQSFHAHNEHTLVKKIMEQLLKGSTVALVSDAGTPGISDPGYLLTKNCIEEDIKVSALPGATAFVPALVASGLPCDRFHFEGFLPRKKGRQTRLTFLVDYPHAIILYESPMRVEKTLTQLAERMPDRHVCIAREISKIYEEFITTTFQDLLSGGMQRITFKGEFVLVIGPKT